MYQTIEVIIEPSGVIRPMEAIRVVVPTRALLTVLDKPLEEPERGDAQALLEFLREHRLPPEARLSAEEIDAQIEAERNAWD